MSKLDKRDLRILSILQTEGRIAKTELAARVHLQIRALSAILLASLLTTWIEVTPTLSTSQLK